MINPNKQSVTVSERLKQATKSLLISFALLYAAQLPAQKIVNGYAKVTAISGTLLTLSNPNESKYKFVAGNEIVIMQMQDSTLGTDTVNDATFGGLGTIANAGIYEPATIATVTRSGGTLTGINVSAPLLHKYNTGKHGSVQIISFNNYGANYTLPNDITGLPWNGNIGGVIALKVSRKLTLAHNIIADSLGFRGGVVSKNYQPGSCLPKIYMSSNDSIGGKGEGIYKNTEKKFGYARGHLINGGGGGGVINAGGGGGGNYTPGGNGGPGWSCTVGNYAYGIGGISLDTFISTFRVFMGGGGGGGQQNDNVASKGARGGGIIVLSADSITTPKTCKGPVRISANGAKADSSGLDGSGAGGAGGSIVLQVMGFKAYSACPLKITANGGNGGRVNYGAVHGGGGGGGQGVILFPCTLPGGNISYTTLNGKGGANSTLLATSYASNAGGKDNEGVIKSSGFGISLRTYINVCSGDTARLTAGDSGVGYKWSNGDTTRTIRVLAAGTYNVTESFNGCHRADTFTVNVLPWPVKTLKPQQACIGDTILLDAGNSGCTYLWNTGETTEVIKAAQTGVYRVRINLNSCIISDSAAVTIKPYPVATLPPDTTVPCYGSQVFKLDAGNPGARYFWNTGDTAQIIFVPVHPGMLYFRVTINLNGCITHDSEIIRVTALRIPRIPIDTAVCPGRPVVVDAGNPLAPHFWSTGSTASRDTFYKAGLYTLTTGVNLCTVTDTIIVDSIPYPRFNLGPDRTICPYFSEITFTNSFANAAYLWSTGSLHNSITVLDTGTFWSSATNVCGTAYDTVKVTLEQNCCDIYLPTAFTPNHDGGNDMFHAIGYCDVTQFELRLYNRWGQLIFESRNINEGWDGTYKGHLQPQGVYFWQLEYTSVFGASKHFKGDVTLIR